MSCSRKARGLAAISVVALAAGLFVFSVGVSPLFADEASTNGFDINRVIDSDATNGGDGGSAPDGLSALTNEGQSEGSSAPAAESTDTASQDVGSIEDLAVKNKGTLSDGVAYVLPAAMHRAGCGMLRADLPQMAPMFRYIVRI